MEQIHTDTEIEDEGENAQAEEDPQEEVVGLWGYLWEEINRGQSLKRTEQYREKCERVYIFLRIMGRMENLMFYGLLCCTDIFVSVFTLLPIRCVVTLVKIALWPLRRIFLGPRKIIHQSQAMDLARIALVAITCYCSYSPLLYWNTSVIYHTIRGQELIKLYIIYNMLEVADRLIASVGQDVMDTLFWSIANPSLVHLPFHFFLAVLYMFSHSFLMLIQATTLNVAFNNHNKVLLIIMMSNNFIEIKGSVFKRFEKNNLFQVTCADIRERFHLFWLLYIVLIRNLSQHQWNLMHLFEIAPYVMMIMAAEFIIDWMKHAFIIKFNNLTVDIYPEYRAILAQDFITAKDPTKAIEYADQISRRMAFSPLPLAAVVIHITLISFKFNGPTGVQAVIAVFINLFLFKIISGLMLMMLSSAYLPNSKKSRKCEKSSPKLGKMEELCNAKESTPTPKEIQSPLFHPQNIHSKSLAHSRNF